MHVTKYTKKSRPGTAATSIDLYEVGQIVKPDLESVAPVRPQASKSQRLAASGQTSKDAIRGQSARYNAPPSASSVRIEKMRRLQEAYENDDGVSLFDHKYAMLRVVGGAV